MRLLFICLLFLPLSLLAQSQSKKTIQDGRKAAMDRAMEARKNKQLGIPYVPPAADSSTDMESLTSDGQDSDALMEALQKSEAENAADKGDLVVVEPERSSNKNKSATSNEIKKPTTSNKNTSNSNAVLPEKNKEAAAVNDNATSKSTTKTTTSNYVDNPSDKGTTLERFEAAEKARKAEEARLAALENNRTTEPLPVYKASEVSVEKNEHDNGSRMAQEQAAAAKRAEEARLAEAKRLEKERIAKEASEQNRNVQPV
jgi:hypothetical protein